MGQVDFRPPDAPDRARGDDAGRDPADCRRSCGLDGVLRRVGGLRPAAPRGRPRGDCRGARSCRRQAGAGPLAGPCGFRLRPAGAQAGRGPGRDLVGQGVRGPARPAARRCGPAAFRRRRLGHRHTVRPRAVAGRPGRVAGQRGLPRRAEGVQPVRRHGVPPQPGRRCTLDYQQFYRDDPAATGGVARLDLGGADAASSGSSVQVSR